MYLQKYRNASISIFQCYYSAEELIVPTHEVHVPLWFYEKADRLSQSLLFQPKLLGT